MKLNTKIKQEKLLYQLNLQMKWIISFSLGIMYGWVAVKNHYKKYEKFSAKMKFADEANF